MSAMPFTGGNTPSAGELDVVRGPRPAIAHLHPSGFGGPVVLARAVAARLPFFPFLAGLGYLLDFLLHLLQPLDPFPHRPFLGGLFARTEFRLLLKLVLQTVPFLLGVFQQLLQLGCAG